MQRLARTAPARLLLATALMLLALLLLAAPAMADDGDDDDDDDRGRGSAGFVYTLTNAATGNEVAIFERDRDGTISPAGSVATGGLGSGGGLGSQGALVLDDRRLFAVNAGSNTISSLEVDRRGVELADTAPSGGVRPISVTAHGRLVYALNAGAAGAAANISGFFVTRGGTLVPLPGSTRPLSAALPDPAQVEFSPDGDHLVVTEKATNRIVTYRVGFLGYASGPNAQPSAGQTPFGFAFDRRGNLIVSEAFGGAPDASVMSSYDLSRTGTITPITPLVATTETAACWVVVTRNGRYAYTTNTGSGSVSGYAVGRDGSLSLLDADGRTGVTGPGSTPIDAALDRGSRFLYVLESGTHEIGVFEVNRDGSLDPLAGVGGLPASAVGLAAS
jgi:6-phosphogluconolactonase (cycloisomerase 2 family)